MSNNGNNPFLNPSNDTSNFLKNPLTSDVYVNDFALVSRNGLSNLKVGASASPNSTIFHIGDNQTFQVEDKNNIASLLIYERLVNMAGATSVIAPTVSPSTDNSTKVATTAFVQSAISGGVVSTVEPVAITDPQTATNVSCLTGKGFVVKNSTGESLSIRGNTITAGNVGGNGGMSLSAVGNGGISLQAGATGVVSVMGKISQNPVSLGTLNSAGSNSVSIGRFSSSQATQGISCISIGEDAGKTNQGNSGSNAIAIGNNAGLLNQGSSTVAIGSNAGATTQAGFAVAIGYSAGQTSQLANTVAIGFQAGQTTQGSSAISIGLNSGQTSQGGSAVAIGYGSGNSNQLANSVAIGFSAGQVSQSGSAVAIGNTAGRFNQGNSAVSIGNNAGTGVNGTGQSDFSVAIGVSSGAIEQGQSAVAIGNSAGNDRQLQNSVAIGVVAGQTTQGESAVAIGNGAGKTNQNSWAVAIGNNAGNVNQYPSSVAIGHLAGVSQTAASVILNGSGIPLNTTANGFYVAPLKASVGQTNSGILQYDAITKEIYYAPNINILNFSFGSITPVATTYYFGDIPDNGPSTSNTSGRTKVMCPFDGFIRSANIMNYGATQGSAESCTINIINTSRSITQTITNAYQLNASTLINFILPFAMEVSANNQLCISIAIPSMTTFPTSLRMRVSANVSTP